MLLTYIFIRHHGSTEKHSHKQFKKSLYKKDRKHMRTIIKTPEEHF